MSLSKYATPAENCLAMDRAKSKLQQDNRLPGAGFHALQLVP